MGQRRAQKRRKLRESLFRFQAGLCHWCKLPMVLEEGENYSSLAATIEHLFPKEANAQPRDKYTVLAHRVCNNERGHDPGISARTLAKVTGAVRARHRYDLSCKSP